ncbi:unnamed protein product [Pleuronectes platessa]|uniref:Uncharacterized protein n=1 Tax=Pleuronectes platessa TaxID=8262 RepID=A0A9N7TYW1_PLEPL|nr:unnamed protein product [Pleuronectes platessa]
MSLLVTDLGYVDFYRRRQTLSGSQRGCTQAKCFLSGSHLSAGIEVLALESIPSLVTSRQITLGGRTKAARSTERHIPGIRELRQETLFSVREELESESCCAKCAASLGPCLPTCHLHDPLGRESQRSEKLQEKDP